VTSDSGAFLKIHLIFLKLHCFRIEHKQIRSLPSTEYNLLCCCVLYNWKGLYKYIVTYVSKRKISINVQYYVDFEHTDVK